MITFIRYLTNRQNYKDRKQISLGQGLEEVGELQTVKELKTEIVG